MVVGSQNDGKDFMVFTDSPIDGTQIFTSLEFYGGNVLGYGVVVMLTVL